MDAYNIMQQYPRYFEDFVTRATYHSNRIEGSTLSLAETRSILWGDASEYTPPDAATAPGDARTRELVRALNFDARTREFAYALNHKQALIRVLSVHGELTERLIKDIAITINQNVNDIAGYRTSSVMILGSTHTPPDASQVPQLMMQLVYEYEHSTLNPLRREAEFHIRFERIHPFSDGNGRTGRILIARNLMLAGYAPPVISSDLRDEYLGSVESADYAALEDMLREASEAEGRRMQELAGA